MPNVSMRKFSAMKSRRTLSSWDQLTKHFNAFHTYISYNLHRPGSSYYTPQANKKGGPGFPGEARRKCKYNREEHRWRCIAGADQALCGAAVAVLRRLCGAVRSTQGGSRPSGTDATRSDDG